MVKAVIWMAVYVGENAVGWMGASKKKFCNESRGKTMSGGNLMHCTVLSNIENRSEMHKLLEAGSVFLVLVIVVV